MNYDDLQSKIRDYNKIKIQIEILKDNIRAIEIIGIPALKYDIINRNGNGISDITGKQAIEYEEKKEKFKKRILVLEEQIIIIEKSRKVLSELENEIIEEVLIEHKPYYKVCESLHISEGYAKRVKKRALKKMLEVLENNI